MKLIWIVLAALFVLVVIAGARQAEEAYTLAVGRVGGTDLELEGCYFQFGQGAMLALHPQGEPCVTARHLAGRTGRLVFLADRRDR